MSEGLSALSKAAAEPSDNYDIICAALMQTERGRWFLKEHARRIRSADTQALLAAIQRIEAMVCTEQNKQAQQGFRSGLIEMASAITRTRAEVAEIRSEAQSTPTASPASSRLQSGHVFAAAERIRDVTWAMRGHGFDPSTCGQLEELAGAILSASALHDPSDRRISKLSEVLQYLELRINTLLQDYAGEEISAASLAMAAEHVNGFSTTFAAANAAAYGAEALEIGSTPSPPIGLGEPTVDQVPHAIECSMVALPPAAVEAEAPAPAPAPSSGHRVEPLPLMADDTPPATTDPSTGDPIRPSTAVEGPAELSNPSRDHVLGVETADPMRAASDDTAADHPRRSGPLLPDLKLTPGSTSGTFDLASAGPWEATRALLPEIDMQIAVLGAAATSSTAPAPPSAAPAATAARPSPTGPAQIPPPLIGPLMPQPGAEARPAAPVNHTVPAKEGLSLAPASSRSPSATVSAANLQDPGSHPLAALALKTMSEDELIALFT